jgi:ACT domain-containing protein
MGTGYHIRRSGSRTVKVYDNSVKALYSGMELWANDGAAQMLVTGNSISFGEDVCPPLTTCTNSYAGIDVAEGNTFNQNSSIVNNSVGHTAEKMSHTGIRLQAADYWLVADNTVVLVNNPNNHNGILTTGCRYGQVSCNTIAGPGGDYSNPRQAAIRNAMGSDPMFVCNNVDRTTHGFLFGGAAYGTDLRGNHIRRHKHGLYLDNTAIIGTQTLKGNLWYNPPQTLGGWGAYYVNALNAGSNPFYINPAMIGMGNTQPPSWWPGNWFQPMAGTNFQCSGTEDYCDVFNGMGGEGGMEQLDLLIAGDSLAGTPYLEETRWIMRGDLLRKLDARPALMDGQPGLLEFHAAMQGSTQAAFNQLDIVRSGMFELEDEVLAQLAANHEQAVALAVLVQQALGQLADSTLAVEQRAAILADLAGHQQQMATLAEADAAMLANAATARETIATEVDALNNGIAAAATIEANHQQVNTIRTATIGRDVDMFTPEQIAALYAIASQCPLAGGNAVYQARSLHALAVGAQVFDDEALCAAPEGGGKRLAATRAMNGVALMPNPAHAEVTLVLDKEYRAVLYVTVYDMVGHVALRATVPPGTTRHALDTSGLTPGAYSYHVQAPDVRPVGEGKLFIAR